MKKLRYSVFAAALLGGSPLAAQEDFDQRVMEAILNNPEVVLLAIQKLETERERAEAEVEREQIDQVRNELFEDNPDIRLVEFFDYRCGYCAQSASHMQTLPHDMTKGVRLIEFPILGQESNEIAKVSIAVRNVEGDVAYQRFHYAVFDAAGRVGDAASALRLVENLGLDADAVATESQSNNVAAEILRNQRLASTLGIRGTPTFVGRDQIYDGLLNPEELFEILNTEEDDS
ncbi:DsbA family protein [uncultured Tateyamaria sp.]|uniref:DsbA family protein n=1 Tax=uncultured Tateyamaria sp. TaxID=455651 RepID=UPI0026320C7C|nr:DsbA family protein [uncultured Tateyamaria sp.]